MERDPHKKIVRMAAYASSGFMALLGLFCFIKPTIIQDFIGLDAGTLNILGYALIGMATLDIIIFEFLFQERDRK